MQRVFQLILILINIISSRESAKNPGVIFQSDMSMNKHMLIFSVEKACFFQLREFCLI